MPAWRSCGLGPRGRFLPAAQTRRQVSPPPCRSCAAGKLAVSPGQRKETERPSAASSRHLSPETTERAAARPALTSPKRAAVDSSGPCRIGACLVFPSGPRRIGARSVSPSVLQVAPLDPSPFSELTAPLHSSRTKRCRNIFPCNWHSFVPIWLEETVYAHGGWRVACYPTRVGMWGIRRTARPRK
jgi:hypothetical protein